jgi:hypothetical protein
MLLPGPAPPRPNRSISQAGRGCPVQPDRAERSEPRSGALDRPGRRSYAVSDSRTRGVPTASCRCRSRCLPAGPRPPARRAKPEGERRASGSGPAGGRRAAPPLEEVEKVSTNLRRTNRGCRAQTLGASRVDSLGIRRGRRCGRVLGGPSCARQAIAAACVPGLNQGRALIWSPSPKR